MEKLSPREILALMASKVKIKPIKKRHKKNSARGCLLFFQFFNTISSMSQILKKFHSNLTFFSKVFYKNIKFTNLYFINTNMNSIINTNSNRRSFKIKKLKQYSRFFLNPFWYHFTKIYKKSCSMVIKFNHYRTLKNWFIDINRYEPDTFTFNLNNILLHCREIYNCIYLFTQKFTLNFLLKFKYLLKLKKKILVKIKKHKYYINKLINILINYKKRNKHFYKSINIKIIIKILKYLFKNIYYKNFIKYFNIALFSFFKKKYINFKFTIINKFIKNIFYLFLLFTKYEIKRKNYWNFSFRMLKKRRRKKKNMFFKKQFNFIYIINTLIYKYVYFIFLYWVNLFFKECSNIINKGVLKKKLFLPLIYNIYYEKKRYKTFAKICFLNYFRPCTFMLYLNKIKNANL